MVRLVARAIALPRPAALARQTRHAGCRSGRVLVACALLVAGPCLATSWEVTRKTVIDPLNSELHRHLPTFVRQRDLDGILGLYAVDTGGGLTWSGAQPVYPEHEERMLRASRSRSAAVSHIELVAPLVPEDSP